MPITALPRNERPPGSTDREVLAGPVERVTFHNSDNGFCVLRVKARGHRDLVTVVGHAATVAAGEWITASGEWVHDRTHGQQFRARFLRSSAPSSSEGIEKYLGSGMIRGIGPVYARKLVRAFGEEVFDVIEAGPERLREVSGIGRVRARRITDAWAEQKVVREIMVFLHSHGVGTAQAVRILKTYGADAVEVMTENPYRLARDIRGIGFKTADAIAMKLGIAKTALIRVRAGIGYALTEAMDEGHCGLPAAELGPLAARLLEVPDDVIRTALELELAEGTVVADTAADTPCVFLGALYRAEQAIAERLLRIAAGRLPWPGIDVDRALPWVARKTGLALAPGQTAAVRLALTSKAVVITGGPGVGKTTIVDAILRILAAKGVELALCAPTGRAARRMSEATGLEARTIHRLLEVDPRTGGFRRDADNPVDCGLLVVDEASMVDVPLLRALLAAVPDEAAVLIVGDVDQLPSVGPGQVLADIIASGAVPVVRLTEVFRQAARSRIVTSAHGINRGVIPDLSRPDGDSDFYFVPVDDPETAAERIVDLVKTRIPKRFGLDPVRDIQVLCPMNRGGVRARSLNIELQAALNPAGERKVERFGWTFAPGDKVMQIENDYGLGELDALVPAYAATVHKSQGSEYPAVVIPVLTQHYAMLRRNLLYTGVTRGKRLVVLVEQKKAVAIAVRNVAGRRRWSKLDEWLRDRKASRQRLAARAQRIDRARCARSTWPGEWSRVRRAECGMEMTVSERKTVLITGCSTGIGRVAATTFQRSGWNVIATMRTPARESQLTALENVLVTRLDVTDSGSIDAAIEAGLGRFGALHVLVNNAGYGGHALLEQSSDGAIRAMYETNVFGVISATRAVLPILRRQGGGSVINVTSMGGLMGLPLDSIYCSTKFAMEGFTEALALECRPLGIRVCSVAPGAYLTTAFGANRVDELDSGEADLVGYARRVRQHVERVVAGGGGAAADPQEVADVIYQCATSDMPVRNQVGSDAKRLMGLMNAGPRQAFVDRLAAMLLPPVEAGRC